MPEITKEQESFENVKGMSKLCLRQETLYMQRIYFQ